MRSLLILCFLCLSAAVQAQATYSYAEPDPTLAADKAAKASYFNNLRLSASKTLENCLRSCGHFDKGHTHDANDPNPCHHTSSQMQCECNCAAQNASTLSDIDKQEQSWFRTVIQRQKDWETKKLKEQQAELNKQNKLQQQQDQQQAAQSRFNAAQQQLAEQQQHYQQIQTDLDNAKDVSMSAYQQAINNGRKESGAMLDATFAGAQQISDAKTSLAYTGVGLGVSLFMHLSEKKAERLESDVNRINENYRKKLIIEAKNSFLKGLLNISKYSVSDLMNKARYAVLIIVPKYIEAGKQDIYFTLPTLVKPLADGTYPSKESIKAMLLSRISIQDKTDKQFFVLYPIIHLQEFNDDFIKKIASGNIIYFDANLVKFSALPDNVIVEGSKDFWGNPVKKDTINPNQKQTKKQSADFWKQ